MWFEVIVSSEITVEKVVQRQRFVFFFMKVRNSTMLDASPINVADAEAASPICDEDRKGGHRSKSPDEYVEILGDWGGDDAFGFL